MLQSIATIKALEKFCNWFKISYSIMPCLTAVSSGNGVGGYRLAAVRALLLPNHTAANKPGGFQSEELLPAHVLCRTNKVSLGSVSSVHVGHSDDVPAVAEDALLEGTRCCCADHKSPWLRLEGTACSGLLQ